MKMFKLLQTTISFRNTVVFISLLLCVGLLSSCSTAKSTTAHPLSADSQAGVKRALTSRQQQLVNQLTSAHIRVIQQGERIWLIIPVDRYFVAEHTTIQPHQRHTLASVASFVKSYTQQFAEPRVIVSGHTDQVFSSSARELLSKRYADTVAAYLWNAGVARDTIIIRGDAARQPIASNRYPQGTAYNRRVVIQLN